MSGAVGVVVRCGDRFEELYATVRSAFAQSPRRGAVVLVTDPATPAAALDWIGAFAAAHGVRLVRAESGLPGAAKNAGVRALRSPYVVCLDAGERLEPGYFELAAARLDAEPELALVTTAVRYAGGDGSDSIVAAGGCTLADLAADLSLIHGASVFRRDGCLAAGGFDPGLEALEEVDLWFRLLAKGRGELLDLPLVTRTGGAAALARRGWEGEARRRAAALLVERYPEPFRAAIGLVVERQERRLQRARALHRERVERRDRGVAEIAALEARAKELVEAGAGLDAATVRRDLAARSSPLSVVRRAEHGGAIDRELVGRFLARHAEAIRGDVLADHDDADARRFGGDRVRRAEVLDLDVTNPRATLLADLRAAANVESERFDCVLLTRTLHLFDDLRAAAAEAYRLLAPGGVLLAALPVAGRLDLARAPHGEAWRATPAAVRSLLAGIAPAGAVEIGSEGSLPATVAHLCGLGVDDLAAAELGRDEPYQPLLVTVRLRKPAPGESPRRDAAGRGALQVAAPSRRAADPPRGAILRYRRVGWPAADPHGVAVAPAELRAQLETIRERCRPMSLAALADAAAGGYLPPRAVAVTFDCGYADDLARAVPLLEELEIPATIFVVPGDWQTRRHAWWDVLAHALLFATDPPGRLALELAGERLELPASTLGERRRAFDRLHGELARAGAAERRRAMEQIVAWAGAGLALPVADELVAARDVADLARRRGVEIGILSASHVALAELPAAAQRREIAAASRTLASLLGEPPASFADPHGGGSESTAALLRELGLARAVTAEPSTIGNGSDPFRLPRFDVGGRGDFVALLDRLGGSAAI